VFYLGKRWSGCGHIWCYRSTMKTIEKNVTVWVGHSDLLPPPHTHTHKKFTSALQVIPHATAVLCQHTTQAFSVWWICLSCTIIIKQLKLQQSLDRPWGFQDVEAPRFQDNWHIMVVRFSPPGNIAGHNAAGGFRWMKNSIDTIGNRACNLPVCSAVPQTTVPPRAS